jgi:hypothetical protein
MNGRANQRPAHAMRRYDVHGCVLIDRRIETRGLGTVTFSSNIRYGYRAARVLPVGSFLNGLDA